MSIESRIEKLEQTSAGSKSGVCECYSVGSRDVRAYDGDGDNHLAAEQDTRPPGECQTCGLPMKIIQLIVCYEAA